MMQAFLLAFGGYFSGDERFFSLAETRTLAGKNALIPPLQICLF